MLIETMSGKGGKNTIPRVDQKERSCKRVRTRISGRQKTILNYWFTLKDKLDTQTLVVITESTGLSYHSEKDY